MPSLRKILITTAVAFALGGVSLTLWDRHSTYNRFYDQFARQVSSLNSDQNPNDYPNDVQWRMACKEIGIDYDHHIHPKPSRKQIKDYLAKYGIGLDDEGYRTDNLNDDKKR